MNTATIVPIPEFINTIHNKKSDEECHHDSHEAPDHNLQVISPKALPGGVLMVTVVFFTAEYRGGKWG